MGILQSGSMFEALADSGGSAAEFCSSLSVLDTLVQVRLNPLHLAQVSVSINRMREIGLTNPQINTVCKAVYISQSEEEMKEAFAELSSVEDSVGTFNSLEMVYMLAKQDLTKEHIKAMINESGTRPGCKLKIKEFSELMQLLHPPDPATVCALEGERALRRNKIQKVWKMIIAFQSRQTRQALCALLSWSNKAYTAMMMDLNNPNVQVQTTDVSKVMTKMMRKHNQEKELIQMEQETLRKEDEQEKQSLREQLELSRQEVQALKAKCESQDENLVAAKLDQNQRELENQRELKGLAEQSEALILQLQSLADQSLQRISSHNPLL